MVRKGLDGRFSYQYVDTTLNGVQRNWVVSSIWSEDGDGISRRKCIDGSLIGITIAYVVWWIRIEAGI